MSRASKFTLTGTSLAALGILVFVHWAQKAEQAVSCPICLANPRLQRLTIHRRCMLESYGTLNSKGSKRSDRLISICSALWRRSIGGFKKCTMGRAMGLERMVSVVDDLEHKEAWTVALRTHRRRCEFKLETSRSGSSTRNGPELEAQVIPPQ